MPVHTYTASQRLYLAADETTVVTEDDPRRATLLVAEGGTLVEEVAMKYGLMDAEGKAVALRKPVESKAKTGPEENK